MTDKQKAYVEQFDVQLREWRAQIALFIAKADKAAAEWKNDFYQTIESLQRKQDAARLKLQELGTAGDDAWEDFKAGAESIWTDVGIARSKKHPQGSHEAV